MATARAAYDPVKAIEGMFNGSITRIGYALKAPADYGGSTKTILAECAKKFHDALDDCEIQLLDAKWYLEHQLKTNRLHREAKARELGTAVKRKHDEIKDSAEQKDIEQSVAKKAKVEQNAESKEISQPVKGKEPVVEIIPTQNSDPAPTAQPPQPQDTPNKVKAELAEKSKDGQLKSQPTSQPVAQPTTKPSAITTVQSTTQPATQRVTQPAPQPKPQKEAPKSLPKEQPQPTQDDFAKPTPQATPTGTNDEFNFESMFGEPTTDLLGGGKTNNDLDFDFTTADLTVDTGDDNRNLDPTSLDSLLPGLESYANQTDDPFLNINTTNDDSQNPAMPQSFSNDFGLPDLGTNIFDELLNDDGIGGIDMGGSGDFEDNIDLSDAALLDMDFNSFQ